jgi:hypothetical protein
VLPYTIRNLAPGASQEQVESAHCERCEKLVQQAAFLGQWIKETENPKLKKQLEKTLEAVKATTVLHRFEQHSSLQMAHPVRSGLERARSWSRPRVQNLEQDKTLLMPKRP